jgi:hypothetical protein
MDMNHVDVTVAVAAEYNMQLSDAKVIVRNFHEKELDCYMRGKRHMFSHQKWDDYVLAYEMTDGGDETCEAPVTTINTSERAFAIKRYDEIVAFVKANRIDYSSKKTRWLPQEIDQLIEAIRVLGKQWEKIHESYNWNGKSLQVVMNKGNELIRSMRAGHAVNDVRNVVPSPDVTIEGQRNPRNSGHIVHTNSNETSGSSNETSGSSNETSVDTLWSDSE